MNTTVKDDSQPKPRHATAALRGCSERRSQTPDERTGRRTRRRQSPTERRASFEGASHTRRLRAVRKNVATAAIAPRTLDRISGLLESHRVTIAESCIVAEPQVQVDRGVQLAISPVVLGLARSAVRHPGDDQLPLGIAEPDRRLGSAVSEGDSATNSVRIHKELFRRRSDSNRREPRARSRLCAGTSNRTVLPVDATSSARPSPDRGFERRSATRREATFRRTAQARRRGPRVELPGLGAVQKSSVQACVCFEPAMLVAGRDLGDAVGVDGVFLVRHRNPRRRHADWPADVVLNDLVRHSPIDSPEQLAKNEPRAGRDRRRRFLQPRNPRGCRDRRCDR